ncbi:hypothetical protein AAF712_015280 [Marasmius tenuissimus]|uniref:Uncharacterized protein n=1 Tax=Marasmius tenuissimus TaxID=585030 RepID=A0ABR2ZB80_9AGAR
MLNGTDTYEEEFVPYPATPSKYLRTHDPQNLVNLPRGEVNVSELFLFDHPATPTIRRHINLPENNVSEEEALHIGAELDAIEEQEESEFFTSQLSSIPPPAVPVSSDIVPSGSLNAPSSEHIPVADSYDHPPSNPTLSPTQKFTSSDSSSVVSPATSKTGYTWKVNVRKERIAPDGSIRLECTGKGCAQKSDPPKPAQKCAFTLCKACCALYVSETRNYCKCHAKPSSSISTQIPTPAHNTPKPVIGLPLKQIHYERREQAIRDYNQAASAVTSRKIYEDEESRTVDITFWDSNGHIHEFTDLSPTFPLFKLSDCAEHIRITVGSSPELFHPEGSGLVSLTSELWAILQVPVPTGDGVFDGSSITTAQLCPGVNVKASRQVRPRFKHHGSTNRRQLSPFNFTGSIHPTPSSSPIDLTHSRDATPTPLPQPESTAELPPITIPISSTSAPSLSNQPLTDAEKALPHSGHAKWPLKFFGPMLEGFRRIENDRSPGSELEKHERAFPMSVGSSTTMAQHMKVWVAASIVSDSPSLISEFTSRPRSTWKEFCNAVESRWPGNKIPKLKELNKMKKPAGKAEERPTIKIESKENTQKVKTEHEEFIIIDSDCE